MKSFCSLWIFVLLIAFSGAAWAQGTNDLPSAPSSVNQPKTARKPVAPPAPPPEDARSSGSSTAGSDSVGSAAEDRSSDVVDQGGTTIRVPVNEVSVVFTVTDKHNHYVKDLTRKDFAVLDDQQPVVNFRSFRRETDLPLQVGLLIDASNSIRDRFKFEQESAIEFLNQTVRPKYDQAFVIGFDISPEVTQDFTDNTDALAQGVRALRPGGGTAMYDALYFASRDKLLKSTQSSSVRRAIIIVSDGDDNSSHVTREAAIEMALRANTIVYTISTNFPSGGGGDKILQRIADATGGRAFQPFQLSDVANAFAQIQDDLRSQYELSYRPDNFAHDGRYRTIAINALHKGLRVRSRSGYYAPVQ
ncbi:MAG TPA: VWA domain-containing protein [Terriglobales bacterium]|nr:VWA domain-containing protein [Terriglobales bacterium]